jgi:hypothetical protein
MKNRIVLLFAGVAIMICILALVTARRAQASTYEVGPGKTFASIGDVPWESLQPGDIVLIHWRSTPYKEKWVICRQGTAAAPITVRGVAGPAGELPVIDGSGATTRRALNFWSENRGVIKVGGANIPADTTPRHITIENLDIRSARPPFTFTADDGTTQTYSESASSIYVEKGENIVIRNCVLRDSGNGFFVASSDALASRNILVEGNYIHDNGIANSVFQHNNYTAAIGITFQYNRFGPLRAGCLGNNLKDRSAGLVVRYNWIEGGNRQLDLVDGEDSGLIRAHPDYRETHVYGNTLIEPDLAGNRQITHYGGDSGATANYRKGVLYFYSNTIVSTRTDRTTLFRLSTNEERCDFRNNIVYVTAGGNTLSMLDSTGILDLRHNWLKPGWVSTFGTLSGTINNDGTSVQGASPGFVNEAAQDYRLTAGSQCVDRGTSLHISVLPENDILRQYVKHTSGEARANDGVIDIGAYEVQRAAVPDLLITTTSMPEGIAGTPHTVTLAATGGVAPYTWALVSGSLPAGLTLNPSTGLISGTPTTAQTYTFELRVTDSQSPADADVKPFSMTISQRQIDPPTITTTSLTDARRNKKYSQTLQATGGLTPYIWSIASGELPTGLSLSPSTGVISGQATKVGTYSFTVQVQDSQSSPATDMRALSIRVR